MRDGADAGHIEIAGDHGEASPPPICSGYCVLGGNVAGGAAALHGDEATCEKLSRKTASCAATCRSSFTGVLSGTIQMPSAAVGVGSR